MDIQDLVPLDNYLPSQVNVGPWTTSYTLYELRAQRLAGDLTFTLPICSLATPYEEIIDHGPWLLPPLFYEAMDGDSSLQPSIIDRIRQCFPSYDPKLANDLSVRVLEMPRRELPAITAPKVLAFSVDTAVEEHGPHLPLATDTIQSYGALRRLAKAHPEVELFRPVEYGQLTWGLPFGLSVDLTAPLLTRYVEGLVNAAYDWLRPEAIYVVDVHGSIVHREAIVQGLRQSDAPSWAFRWLHESLAEFASARGDQHAGGVETILVEHERSGLLDSRWWPHRIDEIAAHQMDFETAVELTPDLPQFCEVVEQQQFNGIVGDIHNYSKLNVDELVNRIDQLTRADIQALLAGDMTDENRAAGEQLW